MAGFQAALVTALQTLSQDNQDRLTDAYCAVYGYQDKIPDPQDPGGNLIDNPQTRAQFALEAILDRGFKGFVHDYENKTQRKAAADAIVITDIDVS